ncbi:unnamed protein product [Aphanomyces euteiches]|uniref:Uncharacterized protein n=2 Tax=Aphanomyces euteiches TaxID=100861 RepID=A0A6G0XNZ8_9STRA|nr:hypothetical protein Ae201684_002886 [Aphanomyces euteiches]KAH9093223.1 hypothetical protein Ae201684P_008882 [Aphanomyces euteiches]KAH9154940.1 hypothetical protein AeRB84_003052 [Aphanomyces euteiches]
MDRTTEKLRSKHVRTLELLQKTLDENAEMKNRLEKLGGSTFQLSLGQGNGLSTRIGELEAEIERLKGRHEIALKLQEDSAVAKQTELKQQWDHEKTAIRASYADTLEKLERQLKDKEASFDAERSRLLETITAHENQLDDAKSLVKSLKDNKHRQEEQLSKAIEAKRLAEIECVRLGDMVEKMKKNEWAYLHQVEALKEQKTAFESEHTSLYETIEARDREVEFMHKQLVNLGLRRELHDKALQCSFETDFNNISTASEEDNDVQDDQAEEFSMACRLEELQRENQSLKDQIVQVRAELKQALVSRSGFATHVDLKKENHMLRQQVEEMQALQKRFLGTTKKTHVTFGGNQRG